MSIVLLLHTVCTRSTSFTIVKFLISTKVCVPFLSRLVQYLFYVTGQILLLLASGSGGFKGGANKLCWISHGFSYTSMQVLTYFHI